MEPRAPRRVPAALIDPDAQAAAEQATDALAAYPGRFAAAWTRGMAAKLGLLEPDPELDGELVNGLLALLHEHGMDYTQSFRTLAGLLRGEVAAPAGEGFEAWLARWRERLAGEGRDPEQTAAAMDAVNPLLVPRNAPVEDALAAATTGDLAPFERLLAAVTDPYEQRPGLEDLTRPADPGDGPHVTFCGT